MPEASSPVTTDFCHQCHPSAERSDSGRSGAERSDSGRSGAERSDSARSTLPATCVAAALATLTGCGYMGPIAPPSPMVPAPVADISAVERGDQFVVTFTTPDHTTDNVDIHRFDAIELRIAPDSGAPQTYEIPTPPATPKDEIVARLMQRSVPVDGFAGKHVVIAVRTAVKQNRFSAWSSGVALDVKPPLQTPQVTAEATAHGYKLTWPDDGAGVSYEISRQAPNEKTPISIGTSDKPEYVDSSAAWDTLYRYSVTAHIGSAESLPSSTIAVTHPDTFAPSVPTGLTGIAGPDSIELSWQRSPEPDTRGYIVYRSANGAPLQKQGAEVALPTYSDRAVQHGTTYRYAVSAVDQKGNESEKSAPTEVTFP